MAAIWWWANRGDIVPAARARLATWFRRRWGRGLVYYQHVLVDRAIVFLLDDLDRDGTVIPHGLGMSWKQHGHSRLWSESANGYALRDCKNATKNDLDERVCGGALNKKDSWPRMAVFNEESTMPAMSNTPAEPHAQITPDPDVPPPPPEKDPPPDNTPLPEEPPIEEPTPKQPPMKV